MSGTRPGVVLDVSHRAQRPQLPRSLRRGRDAAAHPGRPRDLGHRGRAAPVGLHRDLLAGVPDRGLARRPPPPHAHGRGRRLRLERGDAGLRPGADVRLPAAGPVDHRGGRGELRGGHAVAPVRLLSAGAPLAGPRHLLRRDPGGHRARLRDRRAGRRGLRLARRVLRGGRPRRAARGPAPPAARAAARRARSGGRGRGHPARPRGLAARAGGATELPGQHRRPGDLHLRDGRARDVDADLLRARAGHSRSGPPPPPSA